MTASKYDVLSFGHTPADILAQVSDDFLKEHGFLKSQCNVVACEQANALFEELDDTLLEGGGAAANTTACLASLGAKTAFLGFIAKDTLGDFIVTTFDEHEIVRPIGRIDSDLGSDRVFVFVTPDGERTFASYYGVSNEMKAEHLDEPTIANSKILFLQGYHLNTTYGIEILKKGVEIAKQHNVKVAFNPNDVSIYDKYPDAVNWLMEHADIAIMNQLEAMHITGTDNADSAVDALRSIVDTAAVTLSEDGAITFDKQEQIHCPVVSQKIEIVNTNGAGDHYAAGFLYGLAKELPLEKANKLGNLCASAALQEHSARPKSDLSRFLKDL